MPALPVTNEKHNLKYRQAGCLPSQWHLSLLSNSRSGLNVMRRCSKSYA